MLNLKSIFQSSEWRELLQKLRHPQSFVRNFSIASFWNALIILAQFILSPIISRIFSPSEYGLFAIYSSLVFNLTLISTLKYGEAIVLQATRERKNQLIAICLLLSVATATVIALIFWCWGENIGDLLNEVRVVPLLYLIPITIIVMGAYDTMLSVNISEKLFPRNGLSGFVYNAGARLMAIGLGVFRGATGAGLVLGDLFGRLSGSFMLLIRINKFSTRFRLFLADCSWAQIKNRMVEYRSFPLYYLPSSLLLMLSVHVPLYFFQYKFGSSVVGSYGMANSILEIFNRLVPYSLAPIFLQRANELKMQSMDLLRSKVYSFFVVMLGMATALFSFFAIAGPWVFAFVLGENWVVAGQFSAILSVQFVFNFLTIALTEVFNIMAKQRTLFALTVAGMVARVLAITLVTFTSADVEICIMVFSVVSALSSMAVVVAAFSVIRQSPWSAIVWQLGAFVVVMACYALGRAEGG